MRLPLVLDDALAFAARHPVGHLDEPTRRRLLTQLTSAPAGTIALGDATGALTLVATVVDVIAEAGAPAGLEILGARPGLSGEAFATEVLAPALRFARGVGRSALHLARPTFVPDVDAVLARAGLELAYESVFMRRSSIVVEGAAPALPRGWRWTRLDEALVGPVHAALLEIFRDAPSTTLPPLAEFGRGALGASPGWHVLLDHDAVAGLVRLSATGEDGEVRVLGRHPAYRRRGLGPWLLDRGLRALADAGARQATLQVVATNERALALYRAFDFEVVERTPVFAAVL